MTEYVTLCDTITFGEAYYRARTLNNAKLAKIAKYHLLNTWIITIEMNTFKENSYFTLQLRGKL